VELEAWIPRVEETTRKAKRTYGYFNNHFSANAVKNALEMLTMLDSAGAEQTAVLRRIVERRKQAPRPLGVQPLEAFAVDEEGLSVGDHLMRFTTVSRLTRAERIDDGELTITLHSGDRIQAEIRNYIIDIEAGARVLRHDCDDWRKGVDRKRLCKHIAKLFLSIHEKQAERLLMDMWEHKGSWRFEALL